ATDDELEEGDVPERASTMDALGEVNGVASDTCPLLILSGTGAGELGLDAKSGEVSSKDGTDGMDGTDGEVNDRDGPDGVAGDSSCGVDKSTEASAAWESRWLEADLKSIVPPEGTGTAAGSTGGGARSALGATTGRVGTVSIRKLGRLAEVLPVPQVAGGTHQALASE
ncbi:hypothetical protein FOZ63_018588, partial [Perkinsus olseni]